LNRIGAFNFYYGRGNRVEESVRGFGFHNQDLTFGQEHAHAGGMNLHVRFEVFNVWNWHMFTNAGEFGGLAFNTDLGSPDFRQVERLGHRPTVGAACAARRVLAPRSAWRARFWSAAGRQGRSFKPLTGF
jgi:hypothetical protein